MTTFTVEIDWTKASWVDETSYVRRVTIRSGFESNEQPVAALGACRIVLDNSTLRFSPANAGGALYGELLPRREVRVQASDGVTTWTLFRGFIERIVPDAGEYGGGECVLECVDGLAILQRQRVGVELEDSKAVDEAVSDVVVLGYTPPTTSYSDNGDSLSHYGRSWLPERTTAIEALREICEAVYGRFYVGRDGTATFLTRDDRLDSSGDAALTVGPSGAYYQQVLETAAASLIAFWRLNELSGTNAADSSGNGRSGTYTGVTLGGLTGPDEEDAPLFDGINDYVNLYSAGFAAAVDVTEGTALLWFKVTDASVWTDGVTRNLLSLRASGSEYFFLRKSSTNNTVQVLFSTPGGFKNNLFGGLSATGWISVLVTWSVSANAYKVWIAGSTVLSTTYSGAAWTGTATTEWGIGGPSSYFGGGIALVALWDEALSDADILSLGSV